MPLKQQIKHLEQRVTPAGLLSAWLSWLRDLDDWQAVVAEKYGESYARADPAALEAEAREMANRGTTVSEFCGGALSEIYAAQAAENPE